MSEAHSTLQGVQWLLERMRPRAVNLLEGTQGSTAVAALLLADTVAIGDGAPGTSDLANTNDPEYGDVEPPGWSVRVFSHLDRSHARNLANSLVPVTGGPHAVINDYTEDWSGTDEEPSGSFHLTPDALNRLEELISRYAGTDPMLIVFDRLRDFLPGGDPIDVQTALERLTRIVNRYNCTVFVTQLPGNSRVHKRIRAAATRVFSVNVRVEDDVLDVTDETAGVQVAIRL